MRIFLTGFMAAGKTTVGRELAALLAARFVDLDLVIERRTELSVERIFYLHGEETFRRLERQALARVVAAADERLVVATGGGTMADEENRQLMKQNGQIVWLDPDFEVLSARLATAVEGRRPLYRNRNQARRLLEQRREAYRQADLRVEIAADEAAGEVASRILDRLHERRCAT